MPMARANFSRVALRVLCSPDSICDSAACVMPALAASSSWVSPRYSRQARTVVLPPSITAPTTSLGINPAALLKLRAEIEHVDGLEDRGRRRRERATAPKDDEPKPDAGGDPRGGLFVVG